MQSKGIKSLHLITFIIVSMIAVTLWTSTATAEEWQSRVLKIGMRGTDVALLQQKLNAEGFNAGAADGIFGNNTKQAVVAFQRSQRLTVDGIVGAQTFAALSGQKVAVGAPASSRSGQRLVGEMASWSEVNWFFSRGTLATVTDVATGLSYRVKRYVGSTHADCEPLTAADTAIMKRIYGGKWSWERRAIIVTVNGRKLAASQNGMPHAANLDSLPNNNFAGHICIHFLGSKTHGSNNVDPDHQRMIRKAAGY